MEEVDEIPTDLTLELTGDLSPERVPVRRARFLRMRAGDRPRRGSGGRPAGLDRAHARRKPFDQPRAGRQRPEPRLGPARSSAFSRETPPILALLDQIFVCPGRRKVINFSRRRRRMIDFNRLRSTQ